MRCAVTCLGLIVVTFTACDHGPGPTRPTAVDRSDSPSVQTAGIPQSEASVVAWSCLSAGLFASADCPRRVSVVRGASVSTRALTSPAAPGSLVAVVVGNTVTLQWSVPAIGDAPTSFIVEAGSSSGLANLASFDTGSTASTLMVTSVPTGAYYVRVRATNAAGISGPSNEIIVTVAGTAPCATAPNAPTGLTASVSGSTVFLNWIAPSGCPVASYQIEAGSTPGQSNLAVVVTGNTSTTFSAVNVAAGTYFVRVRALNNGGLSAPSNESVVTVVATQTPGVITIAAYPIAAGASDTSSHGITLSIDGQRVTTTFMYTPVPALLPRFRGTLAPGTHQVVASMTSWDSMTFDVGSSPAGSVDASSFALVSSSWTLTPFSTRVGCSGRVLFSGRSTGSITFRFNVVAGTAASACPALPPPVG